MFKNMLKAGFVSALIFVSGMAAAAPITFTPPNDGTGKVWTTDVNAGWDNGRGIGFTVTSDQILSGVGAYLDLTGTELHYGVYEISSLQDVFSRGSLLASGGSTVSTNGLEWIDYDFNGVELQAGKNYLIEFSFNGPLNQGFFFNNADATWTQGAFASLDGTLGDTFGNSVVGAFRIEADAPAGDVPEPASLTLLGAGVLALASRRRRS